MTALLWRVMFGFQIAWPIGVVVLIVGLVAGVLPAIVSVFLAAFLGSSSIGWIQLLRLSFEFGWDWWRE